MDRTAVEVLVASRPKRDQPIHPMLSLNRAGLTALRCADEASFFRQREGAEVVDQIRLYRFSDRTTAIAVLAAHIPIPAHTNRHGFVIEAYESNLDPSCWRTIVGLLKLGDRLSFDWHPDGLTNQYCRGAMGDPEWRPYPDAEGVFGSERPFQNDRWRVLHGDVLRLVVGRGEKDEAMTFTLCQSICPDNSARMIRKVLVR